MVTSTSVRKLRPLFARMAGMTGYGINSVRLLMSDFNGTGFDPSFAEFDVDAAQYPEAIAKCQRTFREVFGMPFREYRSKRKHSFALKYDGPLFDIKKTHADKLPIVAIIVDIAERYLTDEQLYSLAAHDLYAARDKKKGSQLARQLKRPHTTWRNEVYAAAKRIVRDAIAIHHPELVGHPLVDRIVKERKATRTVPIRKMPKMDWTKIDLENPEIRKLFYISSTLLSADKHFWFCNRYLAAPDEALSRKELISLLGVSNKYDSDETFAIRDPMADFISHEPDAKQLSLYLSRASDLVIRANKRIDLIDESLIPLDIPVVKLCYDALIENDNATMTSAYVLARLYMPEARKSVEEIMDDFGVSNKFVRDAGTRAKGAIKKTLEKTHPEFLTHPIFNNRKHMDETDFLARDLLSQDQFSLDALNVDEADRYHLRVAAVVLAPKNYLSLVLSDFSKPAWKNRQIGDLLGVDSVDQIRSTLRRARREVVEAMTFEVKPLNANFPKAKIDAPKPR